MRDCDTCAVHGHGSLSGEWPDGHVFAGIRYIDLFEVKGGRLHRQDFWNDLGKHRPSA